MAVFFIAPSRVLTRAMLRAAWIANPSTCFTRNIAMDKGPILLFADIVKPQVEGQALGGGLKYQLGYSGFLHPGFEVFGQA